MASITVTASLATVYYSSNASWHNNGSGAWQGSYNNGTSRVGIMTFDGLGTTLKGTRINSITFEPTITGGTNNAYRDIYIWNSRLQGVNMSKSGTDYPLALLGMLTGNGTNSTGTASTYPGKQKFVIDSTTNSELFNNWVPWLTAGEFCFLIYNGETANASGYSYSNNYLGFTAVSLTVDYDIVYTVSYNANGVGTAPSAQTIVSGGSVTLPTMTADGYNFYGWATSSTATSGITGSYTPAGSVTLYAVWKKVHTVSFDANGVGTAPEAQTVENGGSITLPTMNASGYKFLGWDASPDASSGITGSYTPTASVTLYAVWKKNGSNIRYNNGGTVVVCDVYANIGGTAVKCEAYGNIGGVAVKM